MPASTVSFLLLLLLLSISIPLVLASRKCPSDVSSPIKATLDNSALFSSCALGSASARTNVRSLFDVLTFSERNFLIFCRSPACMKPVKKLLRAIPTDCLITYHGAQRNLSQEVSALYRQCAEVVGAADQTDEDYVYSKMHSNFNCNMTITLVEALFRTPSFRNLPPRAQGRRHELDDERAPPRAVLAARPPSPDALPIAGAAPARAALEPRAKLPSSTSARLDDALVHPAGRRRRRVPRSGWTGLLAAELERKGAMSAIGDVASVIPEETAAGSAQDTSEASGGDRPRPTRKRSREDAAQDVRSETRCIFTPVKKARKYDQLPSAVERSRRAGGERPPSSVASGVDMLFFNDGEEMPQKNQAQHEKQTSIARAPTESGSDRFSQRRSENRVQDVQQTSLNAGDFVGTSTDVIQEKMHDTAPLSPFTSSPLSFRMSRAEVLQSQLHSQATRAVNFSRPLHHARGEVLLSNVLHGAQDQLEVRTTFTASSRASPSSSPSTSTSSQGSIVLGRPPPGWQKRMFQSLTEDRTAKPKMQFGSLVSAPEDADPVSPMTTGKHPDNSRPLVIPSSRSSTGGDGSRSICDALIDVDANERIMAAATSQQLPGHSLMRFQRPPIEGTLQHLHIGSETPLMFSNLSCRNSRSEQRRNNYLQKSNATIVGNVVTHEEDS
ncbi:hypothetical protein ON010_g1969 [Phytophthora cinnamomi]|nr:hypothetical protein ON010_g1969 [Phytophthora cinnamomi]